MSLFNLPKFEKEELQSMEPAEIDFAERREKSIERAEEDAGALKPLVQFYNVGTSPDMNLGAGLGGVVNGVSKLTNSLGDVLFKNERHAGTWRGNPFVSFMEGMLVEGELGRRGDQVDTSDAWLISDEARRSFRKPMIDGKKGGFVSGENQGVTPADEFGLMMSGEVVGEGIGIGLGYGILNNLKRTAFFAHNARRFRNTQLAKDLAVTAQRTDRVGKLTRAGIKGGTFTAEAAFEQVFASPFLDHDNDNFLGVFPDNDFLQLLGQQEEGDNYLTKFGKSIPANTLAVLPVLGFSAAIPPLRKAMLSGNFDWVDELGKAEIEPYLPHINTPDYLALPEYKKGGSLVPSEAGPITTAEKGGAMVQTPGGPITKYDSAISRSLDEQTQINQVKEQRERLKNMGLTEVGDGNQLELSVGKVVEPEVKIAIDAIRKQRHALIKRAAETGEDLSKEFDELDIKQQQVLDQGLRGRSGEDIMAKQLELPDPRPEADTYLAVLDEFGDDQLRALFNDVSEPSRRQQQLDNLKTESDKVAAIEAKLAEIQEKINLGKDKGGYTAVGGKRQLNKVQKELEIAQQNLDRLKESNTTSRPLVGDQLKLVLDEGVAPDTPASRGDWSDKDFDFQRRAFDDEKGLNRFIAALDRAFGHEWIDQPVDTIGNMLNVLNIGKVLTEESVKKAGRDISALTPLARQLLEKARELKKKGIKIKTEPKTKIKPPSPEQVTYYRELLSEVGSVDLRNMARPGNSPEVAAIVKLRTGRRVDASKKQDIIDAFVEYYEKSGRFIKLEQQKQLSLKLGNTRSTTPLTRLVDDDGTVSVQPTGEYVPRGMGSEAREAMKANILKIAIENGEIQAPKTPLPESPITNFNQGSFIDDLLSDESGQMALLYATDQLPTYKAGGKNQGSLIEEMRLRYEYLLKDEFGKKAVRDAKLAYEGWDTMTWEQKKARLGGGNVFDPELEIKQPRDANTYGGEGVTRPAPNEFKGKLDYSSIEPTPPRQPNRPPTAWTPDGPVPKEVAAKPKPPEVKKAEKKVDTSRIKEIDNQKLDIQKMREELAKRKQKDLNNSKGANC
jgi:hypothetical protein